MENESFAVAALAAPPVDPSLPLGPRRANASRKAGVKRGEKSKAKDAPEPVAKAGADGGQDGVIAPVVVVSQDAPRVPIARVKPMGKGKAKGQGKAVGKRGEGEGENEGEGTPPCHPSVVPKKRGCPPRKVITPEDWASVLEASRLGTSPDNLWAMSGLGEVTFRRVLKEEPWRGEEIRRARVKGEVGMQLTVESAAPGWQGSAWLLERTRGYVARHGVEHSGPGGRPLSVVAQVFATLEAPGK